MSASLGGRYIPQLNYKIQLDSTKKIDFEASANLYGSMAFRPFDSTAFNGAIQPYRGWVRYAGRQFEIRAGLQKIDFGVSTLLRPLQWFNQVDPRDPLRLTNGVYGLLGRYYFLNNANVWLWALYGNEKTRGFDAVKTYKQHPEFGGRVQHPVPRGEVAVSYHHRTANASQLFHSADYEKIPEDRIGLDGKWDLTVGLWFEVSYTHKYKHTGLLTNQTLLNLGTDYTFGVGNGLTVVLEHLLMANDQQPFRFANTLHLTATTLTYPLGLSDNLSAILYRNWNTSDMTVLLNYQHQFKRMTGYIIPSYNPKVQQGIQENQLVNAFSGPGIRFMLVYNH